ncbi:low temperature requirement protein LtrA [Streptococcus rupicaprae]|uniref:Low temperature requirement protein LtrA n=1 Tax=Streptococcus rupicaprae TaxID=759619 RepID=A0ABV2FFW4_9STRE
MSPDLKPMNFPHLVERLSLLVIITFGEMIIGVADYFRPDRLSVLSVLIFLIVVSLFMTYIVEIDHLIDPYTSNPNENHLIYWHYPIIFGLSFVTVAIGFLGNAEAHNGFAVALFYLGVFLILSGIYQFKSMNKPTHRFTKSLVYSCLTAWLAGLGLSCLFLENSQFLLFIAAIMSCYLAVTAVRFNMKHLSKS